MTPTIFGGRFGWLHPGGGTRGVVLCNAFGHEDAWGHNAIRFLAEGLSRRGIPVLRFDYLTTGDSAGNDHEGARVDGFVADIAAAIECLRAETGVTNVSLVGLRLGGAFASLASHHPLVDSLALLASPTNGRLYLRELAALHKTWVHHLPDAMRARQNEAPFNVLGQEYSEAFLGQLRELDLATSMSQQSSLPKRVFLADIRAGASQSLCAALRARNVDVQAETFDDYLDFMQETATSILPEKTLTRTVQWIAEGIVESAPGDLTPDSAEIPARARVGGDAIIETPDAVEQPLVFGTARLFGILCEPRDRLVGGPVVVITNTAFSVHHGDSRQAVRIARELARRGIASLRFDARGIGDSPPRSPDELPHATPMSIHSESISEDVATAAAWLRRKGYDTVIAFGVCSGAYSALRASLTEPAISAVIAVNLQRFYISEKLTLKELKHEMNNTMARLGPAILKPQKWWLVLSGKRGLKPILKAFASHAAARLHSRLSRVAHPPAPGAGDKPITHPYDVAQALERKGVHTLLMYGADDAGLDQLNAHFGRHGKKLARLRRVQPAVFKDIDHSLDDAQALARVIALSEAFIKNLQPKKAPVMDAISRFSISQQL